jgi:GxxExxY protein
MMNMEFEKLTGEILGAAIDVSNGLGCGFLEKVYERALLIALKERGLSAQNQAPIAIEYLGNPVGEYFADILIEQTVILELKAAKELRPEHEAQIINYLRATNLPIGILMNFGKPRLEFRRFNNRYRNLSP